MTHDCPLNLKSRVTEKLIPPSERLPSASILLSMTRSFEGCLNSTSVTFSICEKAACAVISPLLPAKMNCTEGGPERAFGAASDGKIGTGNPPVTAGIEAEGVT